MRIHPRIKESLEEDLKSPIGYLRPLHWVFLRVGEKRG
jgi:hypothetical protein